MTDRNAGQHRGHRRRHRQLPGARYRRIAKRRGKQKAMVAVGNSVLVIVYHCWATLMPGSVNRAPITMTLASTSTAGRGTSPPSSKPSPANGS
jgi:hypothetical protein